VVSVAAWIVIGVVFMVLEIITPTFFYMWFGIAAFITAISAIWLNFFWQLSIFVISSAILVGLTRPLARKILKSEPPKKIHIEDIVGKEALVIETIDNAAGKGLVKVNGDVWRAFSKDDSVIEQGEKVKILKVEGAHLVVEKTEVKG
jgi:membrane protein implicated in regulation of membrane protease activity